MGANSGTERERIRGRSGNTKNSIFAYSIVFIFLSTAIFGSISPFNGTSSEYDNDDELLSAPAGDISCAVSYATNFGGSAIDWFYGVTATSDGGFVAVGYSAVASFNNGDWTGVTGNGSDDAIIVKYDAFGIVQWRKNFGGSGTDQFDDVTVTLDGGFVAVGYSNSSSFGNGDWTGVTGKGGTDAIIVKYDALGNVVWKKNFGGSSSDYFTGVTATLDGGYVAVGNSATFNSGDWTGVTGKGGLCDAIIVKYDNNGNVVWKKNFGGSNPDYFQSVTATSDGGFVAVGYSEPASFGNGDWTGVTGRGNNDAIIVKYDAYGDVVWKKNFGGSGNDQFLGVTATPDGGCVAVGAPGGTSFGNGDWTGVTGKGGQDAIIVKYDALGNVVWKKNFGGYPNDGFNGVTATSDGGFVAVGFSYIGSLGDGDWSGVTGRGANDAIIVKYDVFGNVVWKKHFGGSSGDVSYGVTATPDGGYVVVGYSFPESFGNGDFSGVTGKGSRDAFIVKFHAVYPATMNVSDRTVAYNGTAQGIVLPTAIDGEGDVLQTNASHFTITYEGINGTDHTKSTTTPTNAGTYCVVIEMDYMGYAAEPVTLTLTINKADPEFVQNEEYVYKYGQALSTLNALLAEENTSVSGTFVFKYPSDKPIVGTSTVKVTFTPDDTDNYNIVDLDLTVECIECKDKKCEYCNGCVNALLNDCDGCEICTPCWCCDCKGKVNGCDCRYGIVCGACTHNECGNGNGCGCIPPVEISETEYLAGGGNRSRIITVNTCDHPSADDMRLIVIYETETTNFSFLVKADDQMEMFYQTNITAITVRLADGIPKVLGGEGHSGFIYGSDRISRDTNTIPEESGTSVSYSSLSSSEPCGCAVEKFGMCDCRHGMKCGVCIELAKRTPPVCDCDCVIPVTIGGTEEDAGAGNKTRIVNVTTGGQVEANDLWLVVIYGTVTTNFSSVVKADEKVELFYQNNVTSITVRLADGIPNNIGGGNHRGFIYGTDCVIR